MPAIVLQNLEYKDDELKAKTEEIEEKKGEVENLC